MWNTILPIAVGALIGYCTNYIAIKMLFHPRKPVQIFGRTLPFTPGVIPKNQGRIAGAVGRAVGESLLTGEDLMGVLKTEAVKDTISRKLAEEILNPERTLGDCMEQIKPENGQAANEKLTALVTGKLIEGVKKIDFSELISSAAVPAILEKVQGSMLAMFVNEATVTALTAPVGKSIEDYIGAHGAELLTPIVQEEMTGLSEMSVSDAAGLLGADQKLVKQAAGDFYEKLIEEYAPALMSQLDIVGMVEQKVNEMDVKALEDLVLSVMEQELKSVINLGAVIGAVIGIINVFI